MMLTLMSCCSNSCDCTHKRPVETMRSLPSEAMCLVAMIDCEGWLVSAEDAMNMAEEALDLCLEVQDHRWAFDVVFIFVIMIMTWFLVASCCFSDFSIVVFELMFTVFVFCLPFCLFALFRCGPFFSYSCFMIGVIFPRQGTKPTNLHQKEWRVTVFLALLVVNSILRHHIGGQTLDFGCAGPCHGSLCSLQDVGAFSPMASGKHVFRVWFAYSLGS